MGKQVIFFHGGDAAEDYEADEKLVTSLRSNLGLGYAVHYPFLTNNGTPDLGRREQISREISGSEDGVILVGHSFGASMLLACLSEMRIDTKIAGIFLIAPPFWDGDEDWKQPFKLRPDFEEKLDAKTPLFIYHCLDDEVVPAAQTDVYKEKLPWALFREFPVGGHQFNDDLSTVASDIMSL
jgi:pimeloyl-ACP methyl ester carboxylesterase